MSSESQPHHLQVIETEIRMRPAEMQWGSDPNLIFDASHPVNPLVPAYESYQQREQLPHDDYLLGVQYKRE